MAILAASVAGIAQTTPQKPPEPDPQRPTFRTEANFVRVDVYPTSAGKPIVDLRREDFELLEDGRPQAIDTFEFIRVSAGGPQSQRSEPNTMEAMRQAAADPRNRILVLFLDVPNVTEDGAKRIGQALVRFIDRVLGPDDLIGIMTPGMSPADVVLARRTQVIASGLREGSWGRRYTPYEDDREVLYKMCYRVLQQELEQGKTVSDLAKILTLRRREVMTLEAMRDLVIYLRGIREERKAILAVTEGWLLFRPDARITRLREECTCPRGERHDLQDCTGCKPYPPGRPWKEAVPGAEPIRVGPDGRLTLGGFDTETGIATNDCKVDRARLASVDNAQFLRDLANDANRSNATFYTIDPRGLAVFDTPIYRDMDELGRPLNVAEDRMVMGRRHDAMADLATGTDGFMLINSNDLDAGLRRIADDLSSYYLLGYYSTNAKLDGKFRTISVRVKRPGVQVRARRGYRAPSEAEVAAARGGGGTAAPAPVSPVASALATLARLRPEARFRMHAIPGRSGDDGTVSSVVVVGELPVGLEGWAQGGTALLEVTGTGVAGKAQVTVKPGERTFITSVPIQGSAATVDIRARMTNADPAITPFTDSMRVDVSSRRSLQALLYRRGPATGNRLQPAADFQFGRTERVRVEVPVGVDLKPGPGRVLDKAGQELKVPVTIGERTDDTGQRWLTGDVVLAALGAGDYVIEVTAAAAGAEEKILTAIRVTR